MLKLVAPDGALEIRTIPLDWVRVDVAYVLDLEVVATEAHSVATFGCRALPPPDPPPDITGWLEISMDDGSNWDDVPLTAKDGYDLGAFSALQRKDLKLRLTVPSGGDYRELAIELGLGTGT